MYKLKKKHIQNQHNVKNVFNRQRLNTKFLMVQSLNLMH